MNKECGLTEGEGALPSGSRLDVSLREKAEKPVDFTTYNKIFTRRAMRLWVWQSPDTRHASSREYGNVMRNSLSTIQTIDWSL